MTGVIREEARAIISSLNLPEITLPDQLSRHTQVLYGRLRYSVIKHLNIDPPNVDVLEADLKSVYKLLGRGKLQLENELGQTDMDLPISFYLESIEINENDLAKDFHVGYFLLAMSEIVDFEAAIDESSNVQDYLDSTTYLMGAQ
jgi:hypothetical protein